MIRPLAIAAALACLAAAPAIAQTKNTQCARLYDQVVIDTTDANRVVIDSTDEVRRPRVSADLMRRLNALSTSLGALTDFGATVDFGGEDWGRRPAGSFGGDDWGRQNGVTAQDDWESPLTALRADLTAILPTLRAGAPLSLAQRTELSRIITAIAAVDRGNCRAGG